MKIYKTRDEGRLETLNCMECFYYHERKYGINGDHGKQV